MGSYLSVVRLIGDMWGILTESPTVDLRSMGVQYVAESIMALIYKVAVIQLHPKVHTRSLYALPQLPTDSCS